MFKIKNTNRRDLFLHHNKYENAQFEYEFKYEKFNKSKFFTDLIFVFITLLFIIPIVIGAIYANKSIQTRIKLDNVQDLINKVIDAKNYNVNNVNIQQTYDFLSKPYENIKNLKVELFKTDIIAGPLIPIFSLLLIIFVIISLVRIWPEFEIYEDNKPYISKVSDYITKEIYEIAIKENLNREQFIKKYMK